MPKIDYFKVSRNSFEKNSGYKTTVHAINELIDNAYEAEATLVTVVLGVNGRKQLTSISIADNGKGMPPELLQAAVCEKSGTNMDRQVGSGREARAKYGKYGVGLPKASISQCNKFSVFSWTNGGVGSAYVNGIDIADEEWIAAGAQIDESLKSEPETGLVKLIGADKYASGSIVFWENLDGLSWSRARMGNKGLAPNLDFLVGRIYRKSIISDDFNIRVVTCDNAWGVEDDFMVKPNDPLFLMAEADVPVKTLDSGETWPPVGPLFDAVGTERLELNMELKNGDRKEVVVTIRASMAKKDTFAKFNNVEAGNLPHGAFVGKNIGISLLREGREVELTTVMSNPSEPRERWFGVEVDIPHELDELLGMTNNKQAYTRLDTLLSEGLIEYQNEGETVSECLARLRLEDINNANCLEIVEAIRRIHKHTKADHLHMRTSVVGGSAGTPGSDDPDPDTSPEAEAENEGTKGDSRPLDPVEDIDKKKGEIEGELISHGVPREEAASIAARVINRGLKYSVIRKSGLGLPFFNARRITDVYFLEINTDHEFFTTMSPFIDAVDSGVNAEELLVQLGRAKTAFFLMLEAWVKLEIEAGADPKERRRMEAIRSDWGRMLSQFLENSEDS